MLDDPDTTPFELLGHEGRISIVEALVEREKEDPQDSALSFAELRERTGIRDSGRFNYHLDKLRGHFLRQTEEGYTLSYAGREVAGAILAGTFDAQTSFGPEPLDASCQHCDADVFAEYEDGVLLVECEEGHLNHRDHFPPGLIDRVSLPSAVELSTVYAHHKLEQMLRDVCPACVGPVDAHLERTDETVMFEADCDRCSFYLQGPPSLAVLPHPALQSFYMERGRDVRTAFLWSLPPLVDEDRVTVESEHPLEVRVDASIGDDELWFVVDEDCEVVEYGRGE